MTHKTALYTNDTPLDDLTFLLILGYVPNVVLVENLLPDWGVVNGVFDLGLGHLGLE